MCVGTAFNLSSLGRMEGSGLAGRRQRRAGCGRCLGKEYAIGVELLSYTIDVMLKCDKGTISRRDLLLKRGNGVFPSVVVRAGLAGHTHSCGLPSSIWVYHASRGIVNSKATFTAPNKILGGEKDSRKLPATRG